MSEATKLSEIDAAMAEARSWLRYHPDDERVATAMQRLEEREERLRDSETASGWRGIAAVVALFSVVALASFGAIYALSGRWTISIVVAVVLGLEVSWWTWEIVIEYLESRGRDRNGE